MKRIFAGLAAVAVCAAPAAPALAATRTVTVGDSFFKAKSLTVFTGTTVRWVWRGKLIHNVTAKRGPARFHSAAKAAGSYSRRLTRAGTYTIVCTIHPGMTMTIRVG
jgi:plastocyanin